jgi:hypothetical protein
VLSTADTQTIGSTIHQVAQTQSTMNTARLHCIGDVRTTTFIPLFRTGSPATGSKSEVHARHKVASARGASVHVYYFTAWSSHLLVYPTVLIPLGPCRRSISSPL